MYSRALKYSPEDMRQKAGQTKKRRKSFLSRPPSGRMAAAMGKLNKAAFFMYATVIPCDGTYTLE